MADASEKIIIEGSVLKSKKRSRKMTPWKARWLTLYRDGVACYFSGSRARGGKAKGSIRLDKCQTIEVDSTEKQNCIQLVMSDPMGVVFYFSFESAWFKDAWVSALKGFLPVSQSKIAISIFSYIGQIFISSLLHHFFITSNVVDTKNSSSGVQEDPSKTIIKQIRQSWRLSCATKSERLRIAFQIPSEATAQHFSWDVRYVVLSGLYILCFKDGSMLSNFPEEKLNIENCTYEIMPADISENTLLLTLSNGNRIAMHFETIDMLGEWKKDISSFSKSTTNAVTSSSEQSVYTVRAVCDYSTANRENELKYRQGDIISVIEFNPDLWNLGQLGSATGFFDMKKTERIGQIVYVEILKPHEPAGSNEIAVQIGEKLEIVAISEAGWLKGTRDNGSVMGWFPAGNVRVLDDEPR